MAEKFMCVEVLKDDGETYVKTHFRVVDADDYDALAARLAEAYYMVAADMERNAHEQLRIASRLNRYADSLCEQNIRDQSPKPEPVAPSQQAAATDPLA